MIGKFSMYNFLYISPAIIKLRGDYMNLEEKILDLSRAKYGENLFIEERISKEIEIIKEKASLDDLEFLLLLKENLDQNILVGNMPFLSLYLLGLSLINPLPGHYYNENTKDLSFALEEEYGVDLEKKEGLSREGFSINPSYTFLNEIYFEIRIDKKFKAKVDDLMREYFGDGVCYSWGKNENMEKYDLGHTSLIFLDSLTSLYYEKNINQRLDIEDFKKYLLKYYLNEKIELTNVYPRKATESIEDSSYKENIKSFGDFLYLLGLTKTYTRAYTLFIDFVKKNYPSNREEIFAYYLEHGLEREEAGKLAYDISFFRADTLPDIDPEIDDYLSKLNYTWVKTSLVKVALYSYLDFKLTH